jgi:hypothetical protein
MPRPPPTQCSSLLNRRGVTSAQLSAQPDFSTRVLSIRSWQDIPANGFPTDRNISEVLDFLNLGTKCRDDLSRQAATSGIAPRRADALIEDFGKSSATLGTLGAMADYIFVPAVSDMYVTTTVPGNRPLMEDEWLETRDGKLGKFTVWRTSCQAYRCPSPTFKPGQYVHVRDEGGSVHSEHLDRDGHPEPQYGPCAGCGHDIGDGDCAIRDLWKSRAFHLLTNPDLTFSRCGSQTASRLPKSCGQQYIPVIPCV